VVRLRIPLLVAGGVLAVGVGLAMTVVALSPSATRGLSYQDIDAEYLDRTLVVVAASRTLTSVYGMKGATLFVDDGTRKVARIDNDGIDNVTLAVDGPRVGFVDENHDYLLGTKDPIRVRERTWGYPYGSFWLGETLVTAVYGGFGEQQHDWGISASGSTTTVRNERGWVEAVVQCDDGLWVVRNSDLDSEDAKTVVVDRLVPSGGPSWTIATEVGELSLPDAACHGSRFVAFGSATVGDDSTDVVAELDLATGVSTVVPIVGLESAEHPAEAYNFWTPSLSGGELYAVTEPADWSDGPFELVRIDPATGETTQLAAIEDEAEIDMEVRIQGDHLYVLDVNHDSDSRLRAYRLSDGALVGTRTFAPLDARLSGPFTTFDSRLFVHDFVVTTPVEQW